MTVILDQHKLFCGTIPKVACTSIKHMFFEAENGVPFTRFQINGQLRHIHNIGYKSQLRQNYPDKRIADYHRVTVLRDPIKRFLSAYGNRVVSHKELSLAKSKTKLQELDIAPNPDLDTFIEKLELYVQANTSIWRHTLPMVSFIGEDPDYFDRLYRMEELDQFMADMNDRMQTSLALGHKQTGGPKFDPAALSPAQIAKLKDFYAADYEIYGRYF